MRFPIFLGISGLLLFSVSSQLDAASKSAHADIMTWPRGNLDRARVLNKLKSLPGQQLVIVRYAASHNPENEWVYNDADIEHAKVVWARDMGDHDNEELVEYFKGREIWTLYPDESPLRLELVPAGQGTAASLQRHNRVARDTSRAVLPPRQFANRGPA